MRTIFRKAVALATLAAFAAQPLGAWAYVPTPDLAVKTGVPAAFEAVLALNSCWKRALTLKDAKRRDEVDRPNCYNEFGTKLSAALNDSQEAGLSVDFLAGLATSSEGFTDSVLLLRALRQAQDLQKLAKQALDRRLAIGNGDGTPIAQLDTLKAQLAAAQKAGSGALAKTLDAKIAFLTKAKTLRDASDAANKKVDEFLAKFGYSVTSPSDLSQTQALIDRELKIGRRLNMRAFMVAIRQAAGDLDRQSSKVIDYVLNNPGKIIVDGGVALLYLGGKTVMCVTSIQSTLKCGNALAEGFVESVATNAKAIVLQQDLKGNPISDEEWSKAVLMAPLVYAPLVPVGKLGSVALSRATAKTALTAKVGAGAGDAVLNAAVRGTGEAKAGAQAFLKSALKDSEDLLKKAAEQAQKEAAEKAAKSAAEKAAKAQKAVLKKGAKPSAGTPDFSSAIAKAATNLADKPMRVVSTKMVNGVEKVVFDKVLPRSFKKMVADLKSGIVKIKETFQNREKPGYQNLPTKPDGYYKEARLETPEMPTTGPERLVLGQNGELWYTPDHYKTFLRLN